MNKGMIRTLAFLACIFVPLAAVASGEVYKIVDKDGNVTFTDQRPNSQAKPIELPELSVIQTDIQVPEPPSATEGNDNAPLTPRELKKLYGDFRITTPSHEETFWGTANTVVVNWTSSEPIAEDLNVRLVVDGKPQEAPATGGVPLVLERGEHQVFAEIRDARNRRIVATDTVVFFVKQHSANFNRPTPTPRGGP